MIILTQLKVQLLFDDATYHDDDVATETNTMMDVVYEEIADDNLF